MLKKSQAISAIKSEVAEVIIISKGINPGNAVKRSMSSSSKLASLLGPRATELKVDGRGNHYGNCSLEDMGINPEPPVPDHVDEYKVVFSKSLPKEKMKKPQDQDNETDGSTLSDESHSSIKLR